MIKKILIQITNAIMALILYYINGTFFTHVEMNNAHILFSNLVYIDCGLSLVLFVALLVFNVKFYDKVFPYDSVPIFMALVGAWVTTVPFLL